MRKPSFFLVFLICFAVSWGGCATNKPFPKTSAGKNISLSEITVTTPLSLSNRKDLLSRVPSSGKLTITVENISSITFDVDVQADVVGGINFTPKPGSSQSSSHRASQSGVTMRPGEKRFFEFQYSVDPEANKGDYIIDILINVPEIGDEVKSAITVNIED